MSVAESPARPGDQPKIDEDAASRAIDRAVEFMDAVGVNCHKLVTHGSPAVSVPDAAQAFDADLIVMGRRGLGWFQRREHGSVSETVANAAVASVLLGAQVQEPNETSLGCIVAAIDGSDDARTALALAADIAAAQGARVLLVHVAKGFDATAIDQTATSVAELELKDSSVVEALDDAGALLDGLDVPFELIVRKGRIQAGILNVVESSSADLIAIGHRGTGTAKRMLLGSVSDRIVRATSLPVLLGCATANG